MMSMFNQKKNRKKTFLCNHSWKICAWKTMFSKKALTLTSTKETTYIMSLQTLMSVQHKFMESTILINILCSLMLMMDIKKYMK